MIKCDVLSLLRVKQNDVTIEIYSFLQILGLLNHTNFLKTKKHTDDCNNLSNCRPDYSLKSLSFLSTVIITIAIPTNHIPNVLKSVIVDELNNMYNAH